MIVGHVCAMLVGFPGLALGSLVKPTFNIEYH